jgi:hypothetical protein
VHESVAAYATGVGPSRRAQLEADLALSPDQRVVAAEQAAQVTVLRRRTGVCRQVLTFDRFEDFMEWERREARDL